MKMMMKFPQYFSEISDIYLFSKLEYSNESKNRGDYCIIIKLMLFRHVDVEVTVLICENLWI